MNLRVIVVLLLTGCLVAYSALAATGLNSSAVGNTGRYCPASLYAFRENPTQGKPACLSKSAFDQKTKFDPAVGEDFSDYTLKALKSAQTDFEYQAILKRLKMTNAPSQPVAPIKSPTLTSGPDDCQGESIAIYDSPGFCWCAITEETVALSDSSSCVADSCDKDNAATITDRTVKVHGRSLKSTRFCKCNTPVKGASVTCERGKTCSSLCGQMANSSGGVSTSSSSGVSETGCIAPAVPMDPTKPGYSPDFCTCPTVPPYTDIYNPQPYTVAKGSTTCRVTQPRTCPSGTTVGANGCVCPDGTVLSVFVTKCPEQADNDPKACVAPAVDMDSRDPNYNPNFCTCHTAKGARTMKKGAVGCVAVQAACLIGAVQDPDNLDKCICPAIKPYSVDKGYSDQPGATTCKPGPGCLDDAIPDPKNIGYCLCPGGIGFGGSTRLPQGKHGCHVSSCPSPTIPLPGAINECECPLKYSTSMKFDLAGHTGAELAKFGSDCTVAQANDHLPTCPSPQYYSESLHLCICPDGHMAEPDHTCNRHSSNGSGGSSGGHSSTGGSSGGHSSTGGSSGGHSSTGSSSGGLCYLSQQVCLKEASLSQCAVVRDHIECTLSVIDRFTERTCESWDYQTVQPETFSTFEDFVAEIGIVQKGEEIVPYSTCPNYSYSVPSPSCCRLKN